MPNPRIAVFEDRNDNFDVFSGVLSKELAGEFDIERYAGDRPVPGDWKIVDSWVRGFLTEPVPATLAVIDWDLTSFNHPAQQPFVRGIAEDTAIPVVMYQSENPKDKTLELLRRWQEKRIAVEGTADQETVATKCADIARGFKLINDKLAGLGEEPRLLESLRDLLQPPAGSALHLETFAIGSQELLSVVGKDFDEQKRRFVSTWLGYLIHNRILQFPGPILGPVAAAAYLAIAPEELERDDVQKLFSKARYQGPFARSQGGWWRSELDAVIVAQATNEDSSIPLGRVALKRATGRDFKPGRCRDGHDLDEPGYLCILTRTAVCRKHSDAPESWIPQGADRCRIHTQEFELLQALLGL